MRQPPPEGGGGTHVVRVLGVRNAVTVCGSPTERIGAVSGRQRGRISRKQLLAIAITEKMIRTRLADGALRPRHRGVYIFGHDTPVELGDETSALLACGWSSVLAGWTCLAAWGLSAFDAGPVELAMVDGAIARSRPGILVHRSRCLTATDVTSRHGLPTTTPAWALLQVADDCTDRQLERAFDEGLASRTVSRTKLQDVVNRCGRGRHGAPRLQMLIDKNRPSTITDSDKEELVLPLIRAAGVPDPHCQEWLFGYRADFYWPQARFVLEVDSMIGHGIRTHMRRDRTKDAVFRDHGLEVMRVMWDDLEEQPLAFLGRLIRAIDRRLPRDAAA